LAGNFRPESGLTVAGFDLPRQSRDCSLRRRGQAARHEPMAVRFDLVVLLPALGAIPFH